MADPVRLLVIDDERPIRRLLHNGLEPADFEVLEAEDGGQGLRMAAADNPDIVLLDLGLPDMDGLEVTRRLREWSDVPVIVLSARGQERDKIAALDAGADDYMTKPFGLGELKARVRVMLRHRAQVRGAEPLPVYRGGGLEVDFPARHVFAHGREVHLTPTEFKFVAVLVRHAGLVVTHRQLLTEVWGPAYADEVHYLRVYAQQIRAKVELDPARPTLLITETGVGYRLVGD